MAWGSFSERPGKPEHVVRLLSICSSTQKVFGACRGSKRRTRWRTPSVNSVTVNEEAEGSSETVDRYSQARRAVGGVVTQAKTWECGRS